MTLDIVPPPSSMHSVLIKCFADEDALHYTDHESRKPFKELRINCDEDTKQSRSDTSSDCTSTSSYDDLEMELSDGERETLVPVVDQLIRGISTDFLFDFGGPSLLDSLIGSRRQSSRRIEAQPDASKQLGCGGKEVKAQVEKVSKGEQDELVKARHQPTTGSSAQRPNLSAMFAEKSALKRELRSLDIEFEQREGRKPTKSEKEHLRPLYVRYWKLKHQITKIQNMSAK